MLFNFQWGKTIRNGSDYHVAADYDAECLTLCPIRAVEQYIDIGKAAGWDISTEYLFPVIGEQGGAPARGSKPVTPSYVRDAGAARVR